MEEWGCCDHQFLIHKIYKTEKQIFVNVFLLFRKYLPLEKGVSLHLNKLESSSPKNAWCKVWLKLAQRFWRRRWKCEKFTTTIKTTTTTTTITTDNGQILIRKAHLSLRLRWAKKSTGLGGVFYRRRAANFDLCSALMAIVQWGFFSVPHLLWQGAFVYNGHFRRPESLTPFAELQAVEQSLPVFTSVFTSVAAGIPTPNLLFAGPTF